MRFVSFRFVSFRFVLFRFVSFRFSSLDRSLASLRRAIAMQGAIASCNARGERGVAWGSVSNECSNGRVPPTSSVGWGITLSDSSCPPYRGAAILTPPPTKEESPLLLKERKRELREPGA